MHQHYKLFSKGKYYFPKKLLNHGGSNSTFMAIGNDLMRFLLLFHQLCTFLDKMSMSLYVMPSHIIKERSDIIQSKCEKQELNWKLTVYKFYVNYIFLKKEKLPIQMAVNFTQLIIGETRTEKRGNLTAALHYAIYFRSRIKRLFIFM